MGKSITRAEILGVLPLEVRKPAALALDSLMPDEDDVTSVLGYHVLHFAWYELPVKWYAPREELIEIAQAAAAVMRAAGRHRLAELIESDRTERLHTAWRDERGKARRLLREAMSATGIDPPDTDALVWSDIFGPQEAALHLECAHMLEQAVDDGRLTPGRSGWRQVQTRLVQSWLTTPLANPCTSPPDGPGDRTPRQMIHAERRDQWLAGMTADHYAALAPFLPLPPEAPALGPDTALPLRWLMTAIGSGLKLTTAGYLPPSIVEDSKQWYAEWLLPGFATRKEIDLPPLLILREWAMGAKMMRVRKGVLELMPLGRSMLADPQVFNAATVTAWFGDNEAVACTAEVATALLLNGPAEGAILGSAAHAALTGRFSLSDGSSPTPRDWETLLWEWVRPGNSLGFLTYVPGALKAFTETGRAAALAALVRRAYSPRTSILVS